ncbi:MAG TPA: nucleotidyltransferase domain-containing protein [Arachnia sp.]|nr:nucleotidyltransferase domain-containing protein [Arachnia sp.]HMT86079.1 nucleotidyltransferase domain-containing protein [Arachnia sp.]
MTTLTPTRRSVELRALLEEHRAELNAVFDRYGVKNVRLFGSVARGEADDDSDIDLLFERPAGMGLRKMSRVEREVSDVLGVAVDFVPDASLLKTVRATVLTDTEQL